MKFKTGRSPDIETIKKSVEFFYIYIIIIIIIINEVFLKSLRWAGHPILRSFFRKKRGVFLKILRQAGHPISRALFRKSVEFF